jgi:hypothetical protein
LQEICIQELRSASSCYVRYLGSENGKIDMDSLQVLSRFEQIFVRQKAEEESQGLLLGFIRVLKPWRNALSKACNQGLADGHVVELWFGT